MGHRGFVFFFLNQNVCKWNFCEPASWEILGSDVRHWVIAKKNRRMLGESSRRAKLRINVGRNIERTSSMNIKRERLKSRRKETSSS
jgi:hypothetical protein